jgi:hypothetical protein
MPRSRRSTNRAELSGLAERLANLSDDLALRDTALALSLAGAAEQLRRHLDDSGTSDGGLWR